MLLDEKNLAKLKALNNEHVIGIVQHYIDLCKPSKVTVITDSEKDTNYVKELAIKNGEEQKLAREGHTVHFDGFTSATNNDQARDKKNTRVLLPKAKKISEHIKTVDRDEGLNEVFGFMNSIMKGKEMLVMFCCLGPTNSKFSKLALQLTDSAYVAHSEMILYRKGYEEFKRLKGSDKFYHFVHSAGELNEKNNSKNLDKRRIYIDLEEDRVLTVNNQYAGNSLGMKKLAFRLAIHCAHKEDWLAEHKLIMGLHPPGKDRVTYFTGAFPSACGKTSTAMVPGQTIVGDDIAYIKSAEDGMAYGVNVEQGIFGIIKDVNQEDDPLIYKALTTPRELIVSNILVVDGTPYWLGMGKELPTEGKNFSGDWKKGNKDSEDKEIPAAHKNARYTIRIKELANADPKLNDPNGVPIHGMIYGGRDSDTSPPVLESFNWAHGVFIGASLESETTSATIGQEGQRKMSPMANLDFVVVPLGTYIKNYVEFGNKLKTPPKIYGVNYFLKKEGKYLNDILDKKVWLMWMEGRVNSEYEAIETPVGFIPKHEDLKALFKQIFDKDYTEEQYIEQFSIRITKLLERLDRVEKFYEKEHDIPVVFTDNITKQRERLNTAKEKFQKDIISPLEF